MSSEVKQLTWTQYVNSVAPKFNEIAATGKHVTWAEESNFAIQALQKNEKLAACVPVTVQNAVINVAAVGLTLNPALGYAYLVPESVKQADGQWRNECMLRVSFKGLLKIATDSGSIMLCKAEIVKEKDEFTYTGAFSLPEHKMNPFADRGKTVGVYCAAKTHQGDWIIDIMGLEDISKIKAAAKTENVWKNWEDEMIKKAIIKRASKQWPKTDRDDRLDKAVAVMNEYEGSAEQLVTSPSLGQYTAETKEYFDQLISTQNALGMFVLQVTLNDKNDGSWVNLYNSFEKGSIGKFKAIVKDLEAKGFVIVTELRDALIYSLNQQDDMAVKEIIQDLSADELNVVLRGMDTDYVRTINEINI
jgi:phage RecT family recombinase